MNKPELRTFFGKKRAVLSSQEIKDKSSSICEKVVSSHEWQNAKVVILYESIGQEVQTIRLLLEAMSSDKIMATTGKKENNYALISYPDLKELHSSISPDLIILPAVSCAKDGSRLGRGGGYYDKLLARFPDAFTIALVYESQLSDCLPLEAHDKKVKMVVTENNVYISS
ncbi:MAG: 5-formyltetrahydrofolate cyclo-ligase [Candidatus Gracilibacteria bacterium]